MCRIICITNRHLCTGNFLQKIDDVASCGISAIILREKDLSPAEYEEYARAVLPVCDRWKIPCILHTYIDAAISLDHHAIHMPLPLLRTLSTRQRSFFTTLGASCHSLEEAMEAVSLGCTYITASHIFPTDCKKGLPAKGISFLENICSHISVPVYALGGINPENVRRIFSTDAAGICIMSGLMKCDSARQYIQSFHLQNF